MDGLVLGHLCGETEHLQPLVNRLVLNGKLESSLGVGASDCSQFRHSPVPVTVLLPVCRRCRCWQPGRFGVPGFLCTRDGKSSNLLAQFFFGTMTFSFNLCTALAKIFPLSLSSDSSFIDDLGLAFVGLIDDFSSLKLGFFQLIGGVGLGQIQIFLARSAEERPSAISF